jgi:hypothetical protein
MMRRALTARVWIEFNTHPRESLKRSNNRPRCLAFTPFLNFLQHEYIEFHIFGLFSKSWWKLSEWKLSWWKLCEKGGFIIFWWKLVSVRNGIASNGSI